MPSTLHEFLASLFDQRPTLAAELIAVAQTALEPYDTAEIAASELTQIPPKQYFTDRVVVLHRQSEIAATIAVEVQLRIDREKLYSWVSYMAELRSRYRRPAWVLVVTPSASVAKWAARPIELGPEGSSWRPIVAGPRQIPRIADPAEALRTPELAMLSLEAHGRTDSGLDVARAALEAAQSLGEERAELYTDMVLARVSARVRAELEGPMALRDHFPQSDFYKRLVAEAIEEERLKARIEAREQGLEEGRQQGLEEGRQQGLEQGVARGLQKALLNVFDVRGLEPTVAERALVEACSDTDQLLEWLREAARSSSVAEILGRA